MNGETMPKRKKHKHLKDKVIGPNGEIRPRDPLANQTIAMDVLTGHREEEYIDEEHKEKAEEKKLNEVRHLYVMDTKTGELTPKGTATRRELMERESK